MQQRAKDGGIATYHNISAQGQVAAPENTGQTVSLCNFCPDL